MGRILGGLFLVVFGGVIGYAVAKLEEDQDLVERTYRKVKRSAGEALDQFRDEHPEEVEKLQEVADRLGDEFRRFKGKIVGNG